MSKIKLFTKGTCSKTVPGPSAWAYILVTSNYKKEESKFYGNSTAQRVELQAVINGLSKVDAPSEIEIFNDSYYIIQGIQRLEIRKNKNWKIKKHRPIKNIDLWEQFLEFNKIHKISIYWSTGYKFHPENIKCEQMAKDTIKSFLEKEQILL